MSCNLRIFAFCTCNTWRNCCIELDFSFDWKLWIFFFCFCCCVAHLVNILALTGTKC